MLQIIDPNIWHAVHNFLANGLPISSRMTVVRLGNGGLWLHSPIPPTDDLRMQLSTLGKVEFIVAPSKTHHLFVSEWLAAFPDAKLFGAPGLRAKRPDLTRLVELNPAAEPDWQADLDQIFFDGIPFGNETVWFHKSSGTLIVTDLCQWWRGDMPLGARIYARLTGVRHELAVPRTVRWLIKDRQAARASAQRILQLPIQRVMVAHNSIIEEGAHAALTKAFAYF